MRLAPGEHGQYAMFCLPEGIFLASNFWHDRRGAKVGTFHGDIGSRTSAVQFHHFIRMASQESDESSGETGARKYQSDHATTAETVAPNKRLRVDLL